MTSEQNTEAMRLVCQIVTILSAEVSPSECDIETAWGLCGEVDRVPLTLALLHMATTNVMAMRYFGKDPTEWVNSIGRRLG